MSAGCARWLLSHTVRTVCSGRLGYWTPASKSPICSERWTAAAASLKRSPFSTEVDNAGQTPGPKKKNQHARASASISSVGRKIPQRMIQVIGESGENLGAMHRADVIRIMDEKSLKLVLLNEHQDPPVYKLMSGKQIHEEQVKMWEKNKAKAGTCTNTGQLHAAGLSVEAQHKQWVDPLRLINAWADFKKSLIVSKIHKVLSSAKAARIGLITKLIESIDVCALTLLNNFTAVFAFKQQFLKAVGCHWAHWNHCSVWFNVLLCGFYSFFKYFFFLPDASSTCQTCS